MSSSTTDTALPAGYDKKTLNTLIDKWVDEKDTILEAAKHAADKDHTHCSKMRDLERLTGDEDDDYFSGISFLKSNIDGVQKNIDGEKIRIRKEEERRDQRKGRSKADSTRNSARGTLLDSLRVDRARFEDTLEERRETRDRKAAETNYQLVDTAQEAREAFEDCINSMITYIGTSKYFLLPSPNLAYVRALATGSYGEWPPTVDNLKAASEAARQRTETYRQRRKNAQTLMRNNGTNEDLIKRSNNIQQESVDLYAPSETWYRGIPKSREERDFEDYKLFMSVFEAEINVRLSKWAEKGIDEWAKESEEAPYTTRQGSLAAHLTNLMRPPRTILKQSEDTSRDTRRTASALWTAPPSLYEWLREQAVAVDGKGKSKEKGLVVRRDPALNRLMAELAVSVQVDLSKSTRGQDGRLIPTSEGVTRFMKEQKAILNKRLPED